MFYVLCVHVVFRPAEVRGAGRADTARRVLAARPAVCNAVLHRLSDGPRLHPHRLSPGKPHRTILLNFTFPLWLARYTITSCTLLYYTLLLYYCTFSVMLPPCDAPWVYPH